MLYKFLLTAEVDYCILTAGSDNITGSNVDNKERVKAAAGQFHTAGFKTILQNSR